MTSMEVETVPPDRFEQLKKARIQMKSEFKAQELDMLSKAAELLQKVALEESHLEIASMLFQQVKNIHQVLDFKTGMIPKFTPAFKNVNFKSNLQFKTVNT